VDVKQKRVYKTAYNNAVTVARLDDVTFHTLRHTFASRAVMRGVSLKELQEFARPRLAGDDHALRSPRPERLRSAVSRLEGLTTVPCLPQNQRKDQRKRVVRSGADR